MQLLKIYFRQKKRIWVFNSDPVYVHGRQHMFTRMRTYTLTKNLQKSTL